MNVRVKMLNSVDEYVAGEDYDLDDETSDRFIVLGYAEGLTSHDLTHEETTAIIDKATPQTVGL